MTTRDESRLYDVRTVERNLRKGLITRKDYDKHLKGLDDATDKSMASKPDESRDDRNDARYMPAPIPQAVLGDDGDSDDDLDMPGEGGDLDDEDDDEDDEADDDADDDLDE